LKRFSLVFAVAAVGLLVAASSAFGTHARPKSASPLTFKLVPAFNACLGASPPGMTHGAPLALPSCSPPAQTSNYLTLQAPDRAAPHTGTADGQGTVILKVTCHTPGTTTEVAASPCTGIAGDQIDVRITATSAGIRCTGSAGQTHGPHGGPLVSCAANELYDGMVLGSSTIRISDHYNGIVPNPPGADCSDTTSCPGTVADLPFTVGAQCVNGACNYTTSSDLAVTNVAQEGKRAVIGLGQLTIEDAGLDGDLIAATPPSTGICPPACAQNGDGNATAFTQGLFIP
jgi:hypothetical protein